MECKFAYDFDGVICQAPQEAEKSMYKMSGQERKDRNAYLKHHYGHAIPLLKPTEEEVIIITARKGHKPVRQLTGFWCNKHLHGKHVTVHFLQENRTIPNVAKHKNKVIAEFGITDFIEDNWKVLTEMKKQGTAAQRLHFFENGDFRDVTDEL